MLSLSLAPLVPVPVLWVLAGLAAIMAVVAFLARGPVALLRALVLGLVLLALANPSLVQEEREPVKDVVAVVVDRSGSQALGERPAMTDRVRAELQRRLGPLNEIEPRFVEVPEAGGDEGTRLFTALSSALADVPPDRLAGVVMLTDGVVHDIPANLAALSFKAPLHVLVTGRTDERDRQIRLIEAPGRLPFPHHAVCLGKGPFTEASETALLDDERVLSIASFWDRVSRRDLPVASRAAATTLPLTAIS